MRILVVVAVFAGLAIGFGVGFAVAASTTKDTTVTVINKPAGPKPKLPLG
jgi:hypothetical protein